MAEHKPPEASAAPSREPMPGVTCAACGGGMYHGERCRRCCPACAVCSGDGTIVINADGNRITGQCPECEGKGYVPAPSEAGRQEAASSAARAPETDETPTCHCFMNGGSYGCAGKSAASCPVHGELREPHAALIALQEAVKEWDALHEAWWQAGGERRGWGNSLVDLQRAERKLREALKGQQA